MNRNVIIIGASGHGKVIADIIRACGDNVIGYLDDDISKETLGCIDEWKNYTDNEFVIGIGNAEVRERISKFHCKWYKAIHPTAVVSPETSIGEGTVVMPNAVINQGTVIGKHCIVNSGGIVEHDNIIADYVHVSVGAKLGGTVSIGKAAWIGIGAVISNNIKICDSCMIGAGTVVTSNILESGTYVGNPARKVK